MNFYKHHLGDYDGATAHLSWDEDMAYTRLLRAYYRREAPIPAGEAYRLVRASSASQRKAVDQVLKEFFEQREDGWHNKRADEEITSYKNQSDTNRRIARERTAQRIVARTVDEPSTNRLPNQNPEPRTKNHKPETPVLPKINGSSSTVGSEPVNGSKHPVVVESIPLNDGTDFQVTEELASELTRLYPAVDTEQTLREIRGWNLAHATQRKTRRGISAHITTWFQREQNRG